MNAREHADPPLWRRDALHDRLVATAGETRRQHLAVREAAHLVSVSPRTIQRWLHGAPEDVVGMRPASREAVWTMLRPSPRKLTQEGLDGAYAKDAIYELHLPARRRRRIPDAWKEQGWLGPHMVAMIDLPRASARQLAVAKMEPRPLQRLRRRGELADFTEVPTRFHATLLTIAALEVVDQWRVQLAPRWVSQGHGQAWVVGDAPEVTLSHLAVTNGLR